MDRSIISGFGCPAAKILWRTDDDEILDKILRRQMDKAYEYAKLVAGSWA